ncbi:ChaN family lipoprotein [bacterium]|nr:ChaN family lipoprotein [bacterium]
MKFFYVSMLVIMFFGIVLVFSSDSNRTRFIILDSNGEQVSISQIADAAESADVIFFGEKHDSKIAHTLENELLHILGENYKELAIAMEMFEADNQDELDEYFAGEIDEKQFEQKVRLWDNYRTDYRPSIEFAREKEIPVIAANIPRRYASMVAKNGIVSWDNILSDEKKYLPRKYKFLDNDYKRKFIATMKDNPMMKSMGKDKIENIYDAQCVKDEKMAESIADFLKNHNGYKIISFNGSFHSDYKLGIVQKLLMRMPNLRIINISTVVVPYDIELKAENLKDELDIADFIIFVRESQKINDRK